MPGILKATRQEFKKTLAGSFVMHILVIALTLMVFNSEPKRTFLNPVYTVDLVATGPARPAVTIETPAEPPAVKPASSTPPAADIKKESVKAKKLAPPKEKAIALKPKAAALDEALKKIAADVKKKQERSAIDSAIEDLRKKREAESRTLSSRLDELKKELGAASRPKAQTQGAADPQAGAKGGATLEAKYPAYFGVIHDRVQEAWSVYEDLKDSKLSLIVSVRIDRSGKLLETHIEKSSGDSHFDESLIKAIKKTEFPKLPEDFEGDVLETGFRFCPGCER